MLMKVVSLYHNKQGSSPWCNGSYSFFGHTLPSGLKKKKALNFVLRKYRHEWIFANLCILSPGSFQPS